MREFHASRDVYSAMQLPEKIKSIFYTGKAKDFNSEQDAIVNKQKNMPDSLYLPNRFDTTGKPPCFQSEER